ncbi:MAG TPA: hypothetical protein VF251_12165, partial [Pyrinomonadaceae bacterium]
MKGNPNSISGHCLGFLIVIVLTTLSAGAQQVPSPSTQDPKQPVASSQPAKTTDKKPGPKPTFTLSVKSEPILNLSLKAEKAKLADIGEALSRKLKIPVFVGAPIEKELVSTEF